jgi:very-short-patch-repair endonuclease
MTIPAALSEGEETFQLHCNTYGLKPEREYRFCDRKWRFDFAFPDKKVGVEIEGGTWSHGRHTRGSGYEKDLVKYNQAAAMGWRVFRFTTGMVLRGEAVDQVRASLTKGVV